MGVPKDKAFFVVAVREWKDSDKNLEDKVAEFVDYVSEKYDLNPLIIPMQDSLDRGISERIAKKAKSQCIVPESEISPEVMLGVIGKAQFVLGMRLHTLIYAAKNTVPSIALDYDPKVSAVMDTIEQKFVIKAAEIDVKKLCDFADRIFENREEICLNLSEKSRQYKTLANKNVDMALDLLK